MRQLKKIFPIIFYAGGLASMFFVDLIISSQFSIDDVAKWALLKSLMFISVPITLLGIDHALVRSPGLIKEATKFAIPQTLIISLLIIFFINYFNIFPASTITYFTLIGMSLLSYIFALYRATFHLAQAQFILNAWKVIFLLSIGASILFSAQKINVDILFMSTVIIPFAFLIFDTKTIKSIFSLTINEDDEEKNIARLYPIGLKFSITMILLNVSLYLEQILLNYYGNSSISSLYFAHMVTIMSPIVLFNGYINFFLGPYIRKQKKQIFNNFNRNISYFIGAATLVTFTGYFIGLVLFHYIYQGKFVLNLPLSIIIMATALIRILFIIPSSFIAVLGKSNHLNQFVFFNLIGIIMFFAVFSLGHYLHYNLLYVVALGVLINWVIRTANGYGLILKIYRNNKANVLEE